MNIEIANRLVQLRKSKGLSQEELAASIGISRQAVSKWERAEASPDTDNLILLARLYGVSLDNLLRTEDEIPRPEPEIAVPLPMETPAPSASTAVAAGVTDMSEPDASASEEESPGAQAPAQEDEAAHVDIGWDHIHVVDGEEKVHISPRGIFIQDKDKTHVRLEKGRLEVTQNGEPIVERDYSLPSRWLVFPYPILAVLAFFAMGFGGGWWHPGWLVLLTIPLYYSVVDLITHKDPVKSYMYPVLAVLAFLALGFGGGWWHPGWLVFLAIPLFYSFADIVVNNKSWKHFAYPVLALLLFFLMGFFGGWWSWCWLIFLTVPLYYGLFPKQHKTSASWEGEEDGD